MIRGVMANLRYRASTRRTMGQALLALITLARYSDLEFEWGPANVDAIMKTGLVVTGPDLTRVREVLSSVTGLAETEA